MTFEKTAFPMKMMSLPGFAGNGGHVIVPAHRFVVAYTLYTIFAKLLVEGNCDLGQA